ncbi:hypothetical protein ACIQF6_34650 [Kitasatospora sp. NPDC092948]|uniref:hypothetical protein n=1 Tax=Kitasatospora sp. NPDC092948 TaxID=3364088 RepID=UPI0037FA6510
MTTTSPAATLDPPDVRRPDDAAVFVSHWYVPDREFGLAALREVVDAWTATPWPAGVLALSCYLGTDGDTVLTYAQCTDAGAYRALLGRLSGRAAAEAVEYRLHRSIVLDTSGRAPGTVIVATFDVDGPDRQRFIVNSIADSIEELPAAQHPGMLSANFHVSRDGTRVLNYAEWTTDRAHDEFLAGATHVTTRRISTSIPGVRPIGFRRFHLYRSVRADRVR